MIKFSIIIPVYNVEKYLNQCVDSVLQQDFANFEIILVDDGSPDNCPKICDEFAKQDSRVIVIHKQNGGLSDARNQGIKAAKGDYVMFLDSDDYWEGEDNLSKIANLVSKNNTDIILFKRSYLYEGNNLIRPKRLYLNNKYANMDSDTVFEELINNGDFECSACMKVIKRNLLIENELFFKKGIKSEDIEWYLRVLPFLKSFDTIQEPFYIYRAQREGSITNSIGINNLLDLIETIRERELFINNGKNNFSELFIKCFKSYLAYQLSIVIGYYAHLKKEEQKKIKNAINELSGLLKNGLYKQTTIINLLYNTLGLSITSKILGHYIRLRSKGKISM